MNITLRKANALQTAINDAIRSIKVETSIELNEFQDVAAELKAANDQLFASDARRQKLLLALYNIRGLVAAANATNDIDLNLTKAAFIDKRIGQLEDMANQKPVTDVAVLTGKLEKIKNDKGEHRSRIYGYSDTVATSVLSQEQIDKVKAEILNLKKQKQKINDSILEANIKTEIPLSDDVAETLKVENLL